LQEDEKNQNIATQIKNKNHIYSIMKHLRYIEMRVHFAIKENANK